MYKQTFLKLFAGKFIYVSNYVCKVRHLSKVSNFRTMYNIISCTTLRVFKSIAFELKISYIEKFRNGVQWLIFFKYIQSNKFTRNTVLVLVLDSSSLMSKLLHTYIIHMY